MIVIIKAIMDHYLQCIMQNIESKHQIYRKCRFQNNSQRDHRQSEARFTQPSLLSQTINDFKIKQSNLNYRQVLLPSHSTSLPYQIVTHTCLLLPNPTDTTYQSGRYSNQYLPNSNRRYHSSHETGRITNKSTSSTQRQTSKVVSTHSTRKILPTGIVTARDPSWKIPKLKKHWNSLHCSKSLKNKYESFPSVNGTTKIALKFPPSLRTQQKTSTRPDCIQLKMQCIPFQIWKHHSKRRLKQFIKAERNIEQIAPRSAKQGLETNTDHIRRLELLTRQQNLRKKLLMDLFGNGYGSHNKHPFISYFPHTDYDLALKAYLSRQQQKGQRGRLFSVSIEKNEEQISKQPIFIRRQSCLAFTEFNRQRYDIKMSRSELIDKIIQSKASQQITGALLKDIKNKVNQIISPIYSSLNTINTKMTPIDEGIEESENGTNASAQNIPDSSKNQSNSHIIQEPSHHQFITAKHNHDFRISRIAPIQPDKCDSQHRIFLELIEQISAPNTPQTNGPGCKQPSFSDDFGNFIGKENNLNDESKGKNKNSKISQFKKDYINAKSKNNTSLQKQQRQLSRIKKNDLNRSIPISIQAKDRNINLKTEEIRSSAAKKMTFRKPNDIKKLNKQPIKRTVLAENFNIQDKIVHEILNYHRKSENIALKAVDIKQQQTLAHASKTKQINQIRDQQLSFDEKDPIDTNFNDFEKVNGGLIRISDCSQLVIKLQIASKILNIASPGLWNKVISKRFYFINGKWLKLIYASLKTVRSQIEQYALGLAELCLDRLKIQQSNISLEHMLKFMTGQRIIVFKIKSTLEKQILYHKSKQHHIYLLHKRSHKLFALQGVHTQPRDLDHTSVQHPKTDYEIKAVQPQAQSIFCSFQTILESCQLISVNNRISNKQLYRTTADCQIINAQSQTILLLAQESTSGTITVYFPSYHGTLYVQLIMEKVKEKGGIVKSIGRVYERLKYDNIYFQFTIKGEYQLRIRLEEQVSTSCKISYQGNNPVQFNLTDI